MNTEAAKEPQTTHRGTLNLISYKRGQSGDPGGRTKEFAVGLHRRHNAFWPLRSISGIPLLHEIPRVRIGPLRQPVRLTDEIP
jgi:hypothetical protein